MSKENKSRYVVLGMLSLGPMSGYEIKKRIEGSTSNFWSESYGQLYPTLKQLVEDGLTISQTEKQEGKPERYIYTLTEKGWASLRHWLTEPTEHPVQRIELLLKLFFGRQTSASVHIEHVQKFRALQTQLLEKYIAIEAHLRACEDDPDIPYALITLNYGQHECRALLAWCDETIATLHRIAETEQGV
ncbi:MAG TPA: PadR family transcriptional regulator [Ktedonobacteraceae bacterium]|nr:PadR family transcriptional regulator [Ktedonobacteraceae bacterium]